jgi:isopentenyl diphosphate isomerase/L-lactate dehydrogenase-like FMN-dependent dehydrogenase
VSDKALAACTTLTDIEALARRRTPLPIIDYIAAGSGSERSLRRNCAAFADYEFRPRVGRDVSDIDMSIEFLGRKLAFPMAVAPTGSVGLVRKDAELAVASAAGKAGILYCLSCVSAASLEEVAKASDGPKVFQLYPLTDKQFTFELIHRAKAAGYDALCLTVDSQDIPGRPRSNKWGADAFTDGKLPGLRTILAMAPFPVRAFQLRRQQKAGACDILDTLAARGQPFAIRNDLVWSDWAELAERWGGPFFIKGITRGDDAAAAAGLAPTAVVVCNHGGTFVDGAIATIDATEEVAAALPPSIATIQCGGIRRGLDLLTSLALGATIGMTGRPFMYGAAAASEEGVARAIDILKREFATAMRMVGCRSIADIDRSLVRVRGDSARDQ